MEILHFATLGLWSFGLFCALLVWWGMPTQHSSGKKIYSVSILIPVRNEMQHLPNLLLDIAQQSFLPKEVWILDDHSTDGTELWWQKQRDSFPFNLHYWPSDRPENSRLSPKKYAFTQLLPALTTDWILTIDGDCRVGSHWLETMSSGMNEAYFLAGPITFIPRNSIFSKLQIVELASLQFTAAVTLFAGRPTMCSAANMAFRRDLFPGYKDNMDIASGDDEYLMHAFHQQFPEKVHWVKSPLALVFTESQPTLFSFFHQRKRWASKWNRYESWAPTLLALFVFWVNLDTLVCLFTGQWTPVLLRWGMEGLVLSIYLLYFKQGKWSLLIPWVQILYPFYVILFGLLAQKKSTYSWKGRKWAS